MRELEQFSLQQLQAEIKARETAAKAEPIAVDNPDFSKLIDMVRACIRDAKRECFWGEDNRYYIYEATIEALYGKSFWAWITNLNYERPKR